MACLKSILCFLSLFSNMAIVKLTDPSPNVGGCEELTINMCKGHVPYDHVIYPTVDGNITSQDEANMQIRQFGPLVKVKCSQDFRFFLCSYYAPVCTVLETAIPPCRDLCQSARNGCETLMNRFGFRWPFDCDTFPQSGLCIGNKNTDTTSEASESPETTLEPQPQPTTDRLVDTETTTTETATTFTTTGATTTNPYTQDCTCDCKCTCPRN